MKGRSNHASFPGINQERILLSRAYYQLQSSQAPPPPLMRIGLRIVGKLDEDILQRVLNDVLNRHPALRIAFLKNPSVSSEEERQRVEAFSRTGLLQSGIYVQLLLKHGEVEIQRFNISGFSENAQPDEIKFLLAQETLKPFNYSFPPLMRALLIRTAETEHLLVVLVDHLVCDGMSATIIGKEIVHLYATRTESKSAPLEDPRLSFPEFVAWQHRAFASNYFDAALEYWRKQWVLFGSARISFEDLPFSMPPPPEPQFRFRTMRDQIGPSESEAIRILARQSKVTLFGVFLAALAVVLHRHTGNSAIPIWNNLANRKRDLRMSAVGWFTNSHIFGVDLSGNPSGDELLRRVRQTVIDVLSFQELPLPHLWNTLGCSPRFPDVVPLLDCRVKHPTASIAKQSSDALQITRTELPDSGTPRLSSLGFYVTDDHERITISSKYSSARFRSESIQELLAQLKTTASQLAVDTNKTVRDLAGSQVQDKRPTVNGPMSEFVLTDSRLIPPLPVIRAHNGSGARNARPDAIVSLPGLTSPDTPTL